METTDQEAGTVRQVREVMTGRPVTIGHDDDLSHAREVMLKFGVRHLPVIRGEKVEGMISDRDILGAASVSGFRAARTMRVEDAMHREVPVLTPFDPIEDVAAKMVALRIDGMPVVERGKLVGVVTTTDLLLERTAWAEGPSVGAKPTARNFMTPDPEWATADVSLYSAASKMSQLGIRHLPVVDRERRLVGMLSDRDVREAIGDPSAAFEESKLEDGLTVGDVMRATPVRLTLDATVEDVANVFTDERVGAIVIVDEGDHPVGIVSYVDVISWLLRTRRSLA